MVTEKPYLQVETARKEKIKMIIKIGRERERKKEIKLTCRDIKKIKGRRKRKRERETDRKRVNTRMLQIKTRNSKK